MAKKNTIPMAMALCKVSKIGYCNEPVPKSPVAKQIMIEIKSHQRLAHNLLR